MRVTLPLGLEGVVQTVHDRMADVTVNGKRVRASVSDLRVLGPAAPLATHRVTVSLTTSATEGGLSDLNVIGCTSAEALERADKFLDQALMGELRQVRFIHGHGTGQLRRALAAFLADHPQVARISAAPADQGGGGVTVVDLKE
jgi:DNA mismatch repair protein MutS2